MEKSRLGPRLEGGPNLTNPKTDGICTDLTQELLQGDRMGVCGVRRSALGHLGKRVCQ